MIGAAVGNIIATIITIQIARNSGAASPIVGPMDIVGSIMARCQASTAQAAAASRSSDARIRYCARDRGEVGDAAIVLPSWLARHVVLPHECMVRRAPTD